MRLALFAVLFLAACVTPQSAQQSVFAAKSSYEAALTAAVSYKRLPLCEKAKPPCSDKAVVSQLQRADKVAFDALEAAESAVRHPGFGQDVIQSSVAAANAAMKAFVSITSTLKVN